MNTSVLLLSSFSVNSGFNTMTALRKISTNAQTKKMYDLKTNSNVLYMQNQVPHDILVKIFEFFDIKELIRLATVCTSWRDSIHGTPRFWRSMHLKLSCRRQSKHNEAACWYATRLGEHFRDLNISCLHANKHIHCDTMAVYLRKILLNLRQANLTSLIITDLRCRGARLTVLSSIVHILTRMMSRSDQLQHFGMPLAQWQVPEGSKILDTVISKSKGTLQSLKIDGFFKPVNVDQRPVEFDQLTNGILSLNHLTKLGIDYFILTDAFVDALSRSNANLSKLKLFDNGTSCFSIQVTHNSWENLANGCPELKVALRLVCDVFIGSHDVVLAILDPVLPVYDIRIEFKIENALDVPFVLDQIRTNFRHSLVKLGLDVNNTDVIDKEFIKLVKQCKKLVYVNVSAYFDAPWTKKIAMNIIENRRQLRETANKRLRRNMDAS